MKTSLKRSSLSLPADKVSAWVSLAYLSKLNKSWKRFEKGKDKEALHDLRVSLRQLRVYLQSYRKYLGRCSSRKLRERLRQISKATGRARDLEVWTAWSDQLAKNMKDPERDAIRSITNKLKKKSEKEKNSLCSDIGGPLRSSVKKLKKRLKKHLVKEHNGRSFAAVHALTIGRQLQELKSRFVALHRKIRTQTVHEARITAKKLRYLIEPLQEIFSTAEELSGKLKSLQDVLGRIHDLQSLLRVPVFGRISQWARRELIMLNRNFISERQSGERRRVVMLAKDLIRDIALDK